MFKYVNRLAKANSKLAGYTLSVFDHDVINHKAITIAALRGTVFVSGGWLTPASGALPR